MRANGNGADTRSATAVRNAKRFVQIQVRHIATELARLGRADQCIHVGAIDIHLAAVLMHDLADFSNTFFKHTVRGWIGHHQRGKAILVLQRFGFQIADIHVALVIARHCNHIHAAHIGGCRISTVRRRRNQANIAM